MESRPFLRGWGGRAFETPVLSSHPLTPTTHGIAVKKPVGFSFRPVQFTFLALKTDEGWHARPMSLASSPTRPNLEYAVRTSESPFKRAFASLRPGDSVRLQGPLGDFVLEEDRPAVLLAGGIGITPLKGMAEYAADMSLPVEVRLVYSNSSEEEIAYRGDLEELERRNPRLRVIHTLTGDGITKGWEGFVGRIGLKHLREATRGLNQPVFYASGKPGMVVAVLNILADMAVSEADVRTEFFRGY